MAATPQHHISSQRSATSNANVRLCWQHVPLLLKIFSRSACCTTVSGTFSCPGPRVEDHSTVDVHRTGSPFEVGIRYGHVDLRKQQYGRTSNPTTRICVRKRARSCSLVDVITHCVFRARLSRAIKSSKSPVPHSASAHPCTEKNANQDAATASTTVRPCYRGNALESSSQLDLLGTGMCVLRQTRFTRCRMPTFLMSNTCEGYPGCPSREKHAQRT